MHVELVFAAMMAIATLVAIVSRRVALPFTVLLVVAGLVIGMVRPFDPPHLTKELLYAVFLPGLLFESAFHLPWKGFARNKVAILSLALPGMALAAALTALLLALTVRALDLEPGFLLVDAFVFGALIAATDPIAVTGLFKSLGVSKRLLVLLEGESLINDGAAVVVFALAVRMASGDSVGAGYAIGQFALVAGMGVLIGSAIGLAISMATRHVDEPLIEITLTTIAAYGSFALAEHFGFSGVIASVAAGIVCGNYGARVGMSASTRVAVESFWAYVAFVFNSFVFLLIGIEIPLADLAASWLPILVAFAAVVVARAAVVGAVALLLGRTRERIPWRWGFVLTWGGLRGALSMVLVLGLADGSPHRGFLVTITSGVVALSILAQGLTMTPILRRLGVVRVPQRHADYEVAQAQRRAASGALVELEALERERRAPADLIGRLRVRYGARLEAADQHIGRLRAETETLGAAEEHALERHLLMVEKEALHDAGRDGYVSQEAANRVVAEVDERLAALESHHDPAQGDHDDD